MPIFLLSADHRPSGFGLRGFLWPESLCGREGLLGERIDARRMLEVALNYFTDVLSGHTQRLCYVVADLGEAPASRVCIELRLPKIECLDLEGKFFNDAPPVQVGRGPGWTTLVVHPKGAAQALNSRGGAVPPAQS